MKILIITNSLGEKSGWGRYSSGLENEMRKNNFEVSVLCFRKNNTRKDIDQYDILPPPLSFKRNYFFSFYYLYKFKRLEIRDFDHIHCFVEPYSFLTYLIAWSLNVKYFITIHGSYGIKSFAHPIYKFLQLHAYKNAYKVICVSNYTKNKVLEYKKLNNLVVIPNGINLNDFKNTNNEKTSKENIIVGVGALKERKGFDTTIRAVSIVAKTIPSIKYYIVGNDSDKDYVQHIRTLITELKLDNNVVVLGSISEEELKRLYARSKVFVLTPISDKYNFEGFGLVYLEANANGLPVVGSYDNGGEDAIKDGYNGYLAKKDDPQDTAEKIKMLLEDQFLYQTISNNALIWSKKMSWNNIFKQYKEMYDE